MPRRYSRCASAKSNLPYGQSKVEAEIYLRELQAQGAPSQSSIPVALLVPMIPGFSDSFKALKHRIENGFRIFGDGGMQYIDVRDLAAFVFFRFKRRLWTVPDAGCLLHLDRAG